MATRGRRGHTDALQGASLKQREFCGASTSFGVRTTGTGGTTNGPPRTNSPPRGSVNGARKPGPHLQVRPRRTSVRRDAGHPRDRWTTGSDRRRFCGLWAELVVRTAPLGPADGQNPRHKVPLFSRTKTLGCCRPQHAKVWLPPRHSSFLVVDGVLEESGERRQPDLPALGIAGGGGRVWPANYPTAAGLRAFRWRVPEGSEVLFFCCVTSEGTQDFV